MKDCNTKKKREEVSHKEAQKTQKREESLAKGAKKRKILSTESLSTESF